MQTVSFEDLVNDGDPILDCVTRGSVVTVTREGVPVAELWPLHQGTNTSEMLQHWRGTPSFSFEELRFDLDRILDGAADSDDRQVD